MQKYADVTKSSGLDLLNVNALKLNHSFIYFDDKCNLIKYICNVILIQFITFENSCKVIVIKLKDLTK